MPSLIKYFCTGWLYWCDTALRRNWKCMIRKANTQQCQQCRREVSKIFSCTYKEFWSVWIMILCTFCGKSCQMWVKKLLPLYILSCRKVAMDYNGRYNLKPSFSLPNLLDSKKKATELLFFLKKFVSRTVLRFLQPLSPLNESVRSSSYWKATRISEKQPLKMLFDTKLIYTFLGVSSTQLQALYAYPYHQL